jgi:hypothetical protein
VIEQSQAFHHHFELYDTANQQLLTDQCDIHLLALKKWHKPSAGSLQSQDYWPYFFKEAKRSKQNKNKALLEQLKAAGLAP